MTIRTSLMADVLDRLVDLARDTMPGNVPVFDGPTISGDLDTSYIIIGTNTTDPDDEWLAVASQQNAAALGAMTREENATIFGVSVGWNGDKDPRAARRAAMGNVQVLETALRSAAGVQLKLAEQGVHWIGFDTGQIVQAVRSNGAFANVTFSLTYKARLAGEPLA